MRFYRDTENRKLKDFISHIYIFIITGRHYVDEGKPGNFVLNTHKLVIINQHMFKFSLGHYLATKERIGFMEPLRVWQNMGPIDDMLYNVIEMSNIEVS